MLLASAWYWLFWLWIASEAALALVTYRRRGTDKVQDRGSQITLIATIVAAISSLDWISAGLPQFDFSGSPWLKPLTVALMLAGLAIRWTAILKLGRAFSVNVTIRPGQQVQRAGLYRVVRHPSYAGLVLIYLAIALRSRNWLCLAVMLLFNGAALMYRIHVEEQALRGAFGEEYIEYCRATKRLIPGIY